MLVLERVDGTLWFGLTKISCRNDCQFFSVWRNLKKNSQCLVGLNSCKMCQSMYFEANHKCFMPSLHCPWLRRVHPNNYEHSPNFVVVCDSFTLLQSYPWWDSNLETLSALLALSERNPPVTGRFPSQMASDVILYFLVFNQKLSSC